MLKSDWYRF